jgi:hypothetical protein
VPPCHKSLRLHCLSWLQWERSGDCLIPYFPRLGRRKGSGGIVGLLSRPASGTEQRLQTEPRRCLGLPRLRTERLTSPHAAKHRLLFPQAQRPVDTGRPISRTFDRFTSITSVAHTGRHFGATLQNGALTASVPHQIRSRRTDRTTTAPRAHLGWHLTIQRSERPTAVHRRRLPTRRADWVSTRAYSGRKRFDEVLQRI